MGGGERGQLRQRRDMTMGGRRREGSMAGGWGRVLRQLQCRVVLDTTKAQVRAAGRDARALSCRYLFVVLPAATPACKQAQAGWRRPAGRDSRARDAAETPTRICRRLIRGPRT